MPAGASLAAIAVATRWGACETSATQRSCVAASVTTGSAPAATTRAVTTSTACGEVSGSGHSAQVRPRNRSACAAAGPCRSLPGQRVPRHEGLKVAAECAGAAGREHLDARDIGVKIGDRALLRE